MGEAQQLREQDPEQPAISGYGFGPFYVDVSAYQLLRDGQKVELTTKSFDTLLVLLRHRHRVVVKEELLAAVWPDAAVTDDSLIQSISALRRALGDDATNPRYVTTVARRGYRFIAPVTEWAQPLEHVPAASSGTPLENGEQQPRDDRALRGSIATSQTKARLAQAFLALALLAVGWLAGSRLPVTGANPAPTTGLLRFTQDAPTGMKLASGGALSPDGRHIAFAAENLASGRAYLWVRTLDAGQSRMLEGTAGAARPFWSPDSQFVGFFADGRLKTVRLTGGPPTDMVTVPPRPAGGAWSPRGQIIYTTWLSGLMQIGASGGEPSSLTELGGRDITHAWPQFLPDGDHFLYSAIAQAGKARIMVGRLSSPLDMPVMEADAGAVYSPAGFLVFTRSGVLSAQAFDAASLTLSGEPFGIVAGHVQGPSMTNGTMWSAVGGGLLAFGGASGESELAWFDRGGKRLGALDTSVALHNPMLSPDEKQVYGNTYSPAQLGVWVADIERGAVIRLVPDGSMPIPSPDGKLLGFTAAQQDRTIGLFTRPLGENASEDSTLVRSVDRKLITDWSRDGKDLLYQVLPPGQSQDLWVIARSGDQAPMPLVKTEANEIQGRLSPDGRWLAYSSDESGRWEVYVQSFPDGKLRQTISPAGGAEPLWRPDGRELFYLAEDHSLMAVPIVSGATLTVGKALVLFRPQVVGEPTTYRSHFTVSGDGQRFLVDVIKDPALDPITILLNWARR